MGEIRNVNQIYASVNSDLTTTDNVMNETRQVVISISDDINRLNQYLDDQIDEIFSEVTPKIADWDADLAEQIKF